MHTIVMPQAVENMLDGTIQRWLRSEGDPIAAGDVLVEVQTERATVQVQADRDGVLTEIVAPVGTTVAVGAALARIALSEAAPSAETAGKAAAPGGAVVPVVMPKAGNTMEEGTIVSWRAKVGDAVEVGDVLFEVETDKAVVEVEATDAGRLARIIAADGDTVAVLDPVAYLADSDADVDAFLASAGEQPPAAAPGGAQAAAPGGAVIPVVMPKAGNTMEEGTIVAWRAKVGDAVEVGDVLFEVETDKAVVEVEATDAGRLSRIVAADGDTVAVLDPVAYLADNDADVDAFIAPQAPASTAPAAAVEAGPGPVTAPTMAPPCEAPVPGSRPKISPAARKLAAERGIEPATLPAGSGPGGRIVTADLPAGAPVAAEGLARRTMSPMRKAIARNLSASKQTIPHFYIEVTVDAAPMMALYRQQKADYPCSVNDVVVAATARAVGEFAAFRSRLDGDALIESDAANIGIAVALDDGLVVPVLMGADRLSLRDLAAEARRLVEAARGGKIEGLGQGVLTITNLGMYGVQRFSAIINPPEAAILAVGAAREDVVVKDGEILAGRVMTLTLSCDHLVIDGAVAAQFLARLKEVLESPEVLLT